MWELEKLHGLNDPSLYAVVMKVCERIASAEAARAVREDMLAQGWSMDRR